MGEKPNKMDAIIQIQNNETEKLRQMSIISFQPNTVSELKAITENKDAKIDQNDISKIGKSSPKLSPQQIKNQKQFFSNYKFSMALNEEEQISKKKKSSQFSVKKKYSADSLKFE